MPQTEQKPSLVMRFVAILVMAIAAFIIFKFVVGLLAGVATLIAIVGALIALVWAYTTLRR